MTKTASAPSFTIGVAASYTLSVQNTGTAATTAASTITDAIPTGLTLGTLPAGCTAAGQTVICTVATGLAAGSSALFVIPVTPTASAASSVTNTATVSGGGDAGCPAAARCTSAVTTPVGASADLTLTKTNGTTSVIAGGSTTYTIVLTNNGPSTANGTVVADPAATGLTKTAVTCTAAGGAVCPAVTVANFQSGVTVVTLPSGGSLTFTVIANVTATSGSVTNSVTATLPAGTTDPTPTGTVSDTDTVASPADLVMSKVVSNATPAIGSNVTFTLTVTNNGPSAATAVSVADLLPAGYAYVSDNAGGAYVPGTGVWTIGTLANAASATLQIVATVNQAGPYANTATVTSTTTDPTPGNNNSTATTTPIANLWLTVDKTAGTPSGNTAGSTIAYSFLVTNTGNVTITGIAVNDALLDAAAVCAATTLAPAATTTCTGTHTITQAEVNAGTVNNSATVTGTPPTGPAVTSPPDTTTTPIASTPSLTLDKTAAVADTNANGVVGDAGDTITYSFSATNTGNVTLAPVTVADPLLPSLACSIATLAPGATASCAATGNTYVITTADAVAGTRANTATATGDAPGSAVDPTASDTATVTTETLLIDAVDDAFPSVNGENGGATTSVLVNDTLNGVPVTPATVTLTPGLSPNPGLSMNPDGTITIAPGTTAGTYDYPYTICEVLNPSNCDTATATVVVVSDLALRVLKTVSVREVKIGDLVRYTITVENVGTSNLVNGSVLDSPAAGFSYVEGSLSVVDGDNAATATGQSPIRFDGIDVAAGETATLVYAMRVGAGVRPGLQVNQAQATTQSGQSISNVSRAEVTLVADALVDDSLLIGTVFDDRDGDTWQDSAALNGVRVQGGFAPEAYVPGSTTVDRGAGAQPEADVSSPMLHGIDVGAITSRQSSADPAANHQVVIRQRLNEPAFTGDFVLTSKQGVTVRMDAAGNTTVEKSGEAAKGLNAAQPRVERRVAQGEGGYVVDYVISNLGIDERGIPGVRIASVEGLLIETDQFGRYHLEGIAGGDTGRGRNFILKVDPSTLPPGTVFTTDNPLVRRITPGVPVRFDFGVKLPVEEIQGDEQQVELELGEVLFAPGSAKLRDEYLPVVDQIAAKVIEFRGGEVLISATGDTQALAFDRATAVKDALVAKMPADIGNALTVSVRTDVDDPSTMAVGVAEGGPLLGTVLFDTDQSAIKTQFLPLIDKVAAYLDEKGGGAVAIVGHADPRGSDGYNIALGMRRAKSVYEAIAARLSPEVRARVRVESSNNPAAPAGSK